MIELYSWATTNSHKIHIMLEELGWNYNLHPINTDTGDQFTQEFLEICPNGKVPALIDTLESGGEPIIIFESGAILLYLAEKSGKFMPVDARSRFDVIKWLMFQMGGVDPILGQLHHFRANRKIENLYALDRFTKEAYRLYKVLDVQLSRHDYIVSDEYTIADMATFPWIRNFKRQGIELNNFPNLANWLNVVANRPAVKRGIMILDGQRKLGLIAAKNA